MGVSSASGRLLLPGALAGSSIARSGATGSLTGTGALAGAAAARSAATGQFAAMDLAGAAHAISAATGLPVGLGRLAGASIARAAAFGSFIPPLPLTSGPYLVAGSTGRTLTASGAAHTMPRAKSIGPIDDNETVTITWDFTADLDPNEDITEVLDTQCVVKTGTDTQASSRLMGTGQIGNAPLPPWGSGRATAAVRQQFSGGIAGVTYSAAQLVLTSRGNKINKIVLFPVQPST